MNKKQTFQDKVIWIIGASSGIGEALAYELASRGAILALSARRKGLLEKLEVALGGKKHGVFALDVCDADAVMCTADAVRAAFGRIDSVIFLAAAYTPMKLDNLDPAVVRQIINVNLSGAFHVVHAVLPVFEGQPGGGQIVLCSSVAGYIGLPGGQPYSATKAAVINLAESLRAELPERIDVRLVSPGFVRTGLTDKNDFDMPAIIEPGQAAKAIADGLSGRCFEIHFPRRFTFLLKILRLIPYCLVLGITRKFR